MILTNNLNHPNLEDFFNLHNHPNLDDLLNLRKSSKFGRFVQFS